MVLAILAKPSHSIKCAALTTSLPPHLRQQVFEIGRIGAQGEGAQVEVR
jgi:hypothetical protein